MNNEAKDWQFKGWRNLTIGHKIFVIVFSALVIVAICMIGHNVDQGGVTQNHVHANPIHTDAVLDVEHPNLNEENIHATTAQKEAFIKKIGIPAERAFKAHRNYQILPSVVVAQGAIESGWGMSDLTTKSHNLFGVKGTYHGKSASYRTKEWTGSGYVIETQNFRAYPSLEASIMDHDTLLRNIFVKKNHVLSYREEAYLIKKNGYATDPNYAQKIVQTIQTYHLDKLDKDALK